MKLLKIRSFLIILSMFVLSCKRPSLIGSEAALEPQKTVIQFSSTKIGETSYQTFILNNMGETQASNIQVNNVKSPFQINSDKMLVNNVPRCTDILSAGQDCQITFQFTPVDVDIFNSEVKISYHDGKTPKEVNFTLSAQSQLPPLAMVEIEPTSSSAFGLLELGETKAQEIIVKNYGDRRAENIQFGPLNSPFRYLGGSFPGAGGTCTDTLAANGQSCVVYIEFVPNVVSHFEIHSTIRYYDGMESQSIPLTFVGEGESPLTGFLGFTQGISGTFADTKMLESSSLIITLKNSGNDDVSDITPLPISLPFSYAGGSYPGIGGDCSTELEPDEECSIEIGFSPTNNQNFSEDLIINYNDSATIKTLIFPIGGVGTPLLPADIQVVDITPIAFGTKEVGDSAENLITITNAGDLDATLVTTDSFVGPFTYSGGAFPGTDGTCGAQIVRNESCTLDLSFTPATGILYLGNHIIGYNDGETLQSLTIDFSGMGDSAGKLDTTFSDGGMFQLEEESDNTVPSLVSTSSDEIIIAVDESPLGSDKDFVNMRLNSEGEVDALYGDNGAAVTDFHGNSEDQAFKIIKQDDDKIIQVGSVDGDIGIVRYNQDGSLDSSFSGNGKERHDLQLLSNNESFPTSVAIDSDNNIIVAGEHQLGGGNSKSFILRYGEDGSPNWLDLLGLGILADNTCDFFSSKKERITSIVVDSQDRLLVAGYYRDASQYNSFVIRLKSNGHMDSTFANNGYFMTDFSGSNKNDQIQDIAVQSDGKIVFTGSKSTANQTDIFLHRLNSDGTNDNSFGIDGHVTIDSDGQEEEAFALKIDSAGRILIGGKTKVGDNWDMALFRILPTGQRDLGFGAFGALTFDVDGGNEAVRSLTIQSSGKILVAGDREKAGTMNSMLMRFAP